MDYKLKVYSIWHVGQRKDADGNPHQEDSLYPYFGEESEKDRTFILCDGMGGHDAGEVASAAVCDAMSESIKNNAHDSEGVFTDEDLSKALNDAYDALDSKDSGAVKKMGTTMTFLKLHKAGATIAHIGDSRVYHIRPGKTAAETKILFETQDHSLVNDLVRVGEMTREEARHSNKKNIITRAMQPNMERRSKADIYHTSDIKPGDFFYMCSDGMLEKDEMDDGSALKNIFSQIIADDVEKKEILKGATKDNSDNHTAFIIHITDVILSNCVKKRTNFESDSDTEHLAIVEDDVTNTLSLTESKDTEKVKEEFNNLNDDKNINKDSIKLKDIVNENSETENIENINKGKSNDNNRKNRKKLYVYVALFICVLFGFLGYKYYHKNDVKPTSENVERHKKNVKDKKLIDVKKRTQKQKENKEEKSVNQQEKSEVTKHKEISNKEDNPVKNTAKKTVSGELKEGKGQVVKGVDNAVDKLKEDSSSKK